MKKQRKCHSHAQEPCACAVRLNVRAPTPVNLDQVFQPLFRGRTPGPHARVDANPDQKIMSEYREFKRK